MPSNTEPAAVASNINNPYAFYWRGQVYRRKGDADHAIEDFSRAAVQSPPNDIGAYLARGQLYSAKGDYPHAIADFDKVLSITPDDKNTQQLRQSTLALQTEMARIHDKPASPAAQRPAPAATAVATATTTPPAPATQPVSPPAIGRGGFRGWPRRNKTPPQASPHGPSQIRRRQRRGV